MAVREVLNMVEGKGKEEEKKPRGGRRKNAFGNSNSTFISKEIRDWARKESLNDKDFLRWK